jgi:hypothetical protein
MRFISSQGRQEVVSVLLENPGFFFDVKELLVDFLDIDRLLVSCTSDTLSRADGD